MNRKFQVFISSTYTDLKAERQAAVQAVLDAGHIPAGMELFSAGDEEQWNVITRWIDESDIYMLILGVRYGSIEPKSKKSYTHLEYEYAAAQKKPIFAVYLGEKSFKERVNELAQTIALEDRAGYEDFRKLVKSKMCSEFIDSRDITIAVLKTLGQFAKKPELQSAGWVRARDVPDTSKLANENSQLGMEVARLTSDLAKLSAENQALRTKPIESTSGDDIRIGKFTYRQILTILSEARLSATRKESLLDLFLLNQEKLVLGHTDPEYEYDSSDDGGLYNIVSPKLITLGLVKRTERYNKPSVQTTEDGELFLATHSLKKVGQG